jgi:transposase-like protein
MPDGELKQQWEARIAAFRDSGLSGARWCKEQGIKPHQFYYWKAKLSATQPEKPAGWLKVEVSEPLVSIAVRIGAATIKVEPGFDPELLAEVVSALTGTC